MAAPLTLRVTLLVLVASHAGSAWLGWALRDRRAEADVASAQAARQATRADTALAARQLGRSNAQAGAHFESQRLAVQARRTAQFNTLQRDIENHVKNPGRSRGDADADFVRIWREANAGRPAPP